MKYIRYILYLLLLSVLVTGAYSLWIFLGHLLQKPVVFPTKGIVAFSIFALLPIAVALQKEIKNRITLPKEVKSNYLLQKASAELEQDKITKEKLQSIIYEIVIEGQMFEKDYEEDNYSVYISQVNDSSLEPKRKENNVKNRIIIEVEYTSNNKVIICVHKENQYIAFSNLENELVLWEPL